MTNTEIKELHKTLGTFLVFHVDLEPFESVFFTFNDGSIASKAHSFTYNHLIIKGFEKNKFCEVSIKDGGYYGKDGFETDNLASIKSSSLLPGMAFKNGDFFTIEANVPKSYNGKINCNVFATYYDQQSDFSFLKELIKNKSIISGEENRVKLEW